MSDIVYPAFPRRGLGLVKASDAVTWGEDRAASRSPHRAFRDAMRRLSDTGQASTADMAIRSFERALKFPLPDGRPHPDFVALAMKELLGVQSEHRAAFRHARTAATALLALAFPELEPTQPECA